MVNQLPPPHPSLPTSDSASHDTRSRGPSELPYAHLHSIHHKGIFLRPIDLLSRHVLFNIVGTIFRVINKSSHFLPKLRTRSLLTVPFAALLLTFQTFHGELLQAQQIANTDWSLTEIPAQLPPPEASLPAPDSDEPLVVNYQSVNHSQVSLERQTEVRSKAEKEQYHFHQPVEFPNSFRTSNPQLRLSFHRTRDGLTISPRPGSPNLLDDSLVVPDWSVNYKRRPSTWISWPSL